MLSVLRGNTFVFLEQFSSPILFLFFFMSDSKSNAIVLGITGGIACGKSEAGRILEQMDFAVLDADSVAHKQMQKGSVVYHQVIDCFGKNILTEREEISRPALGKIIFDDPVQRARLNQLVHPFVRGELEAWIAEKQKINKPAAVIIPLLFESGMEDLGWHAVLCISCDEQTIYKRMEKRGFDRPDAEKRIRAQMTLEEKEKRADYTILNNGTMEDLKKNIQKTLTFIESER